MSRGPDQQATVCLPTARQLEYQDWEFGLFFHFGIRTFYEGHRDWDGKPMPAEGFDPSELNCGNWAEAAAEAGARYMVLVAKHHDGFADWPSKYTDYCVAGAPWRDGKGDVVREFVDACRQYGLKTGLYYSPADANSPVYDDEKAYDDYFINQVSELLTGYGEIDILWFDGCGSENHEYDWPRIIAEIRRMQPGILIFNMGDPDFRWIGNEAGLAPLPTWNTVEDVHVSVRTSDKEALTTKKWLPAECDLMMRDRNWFYSDRDEDTVKTPEELLGIYYRSVGRGCNMLLNIGPDRRGLLPEKDKQSLLAFGAEVKRRFGNPVASLDDFERDGDTWTYGPGGGDAFHFDHVVLQEDLAQGERVRRFRILIRSYCGGEPIVLWEGRNIGHKAICPFPLVRARTVTVEILETDGPVAMRNIQVFRATV
jgi:alpha-L-fucosidase